ncbi:MAG: hypothetical protein IPL70_06000 [Uliginosibacterium sp.]|nr:hypothetical protein [Uliginosibacterium sp.]
MIIRFEFAALASGMQKGMARNAREAQATLDNMQARINRLNNEVEKGNQATRYYRSHAERLEAQLAETQRLLAEKAEQRNEASLIAWTLGLKGDATRTVFENGLTQGKFAAQADPSAALRRAEYDISREFDKLVEAALSGGSLKRDPRKILAISDWYIPAT